MLGNPGSRLAHGRQPMLPVDIAVAHLVRIVDDVVGIIKASIQLWPTLVEIAYFEKRRNGLPRTLVQNQKK